MILRMRQRPNTKKAGRFPLREDEGPAKNLLVKRQRNVQQDTKTLWSIAGIFHYHEQKSYIKLGRFSSSFAEITDVMSSKQVSPQRGTHCLTY